MRASVGRVNGSLGASRGRVNGSRAVGDRGKTNGASLKSGAQLRSRRRHRPRSLAAVAVALIVLPALLVVAAPHTRSGLAADGDFAEWATVAAVRDGDAASAAPVAPDLQEVRVLPDGRVFGVYASAAQPFFGSDTERVVRVFVDADGDAATGFDLGGVGAELMLEGAGKGGSLLAVGLLTFDAGRAADDWNGWARAAGGSLAVRGSQLEAVFPGPVSEGAVAVVAVSSVEGDDMQDPPTSAAGALVVSQAPRAPGIIAGGESELLLLELTLRAEGAPRTLTALTLTPTGAADFSLVRTARLSIDGGGAVEASALSAASISFAFETPLALAPSESARALVTVSVLGGREFAPFEGSSFGASFESAEFGDDGAALAVRPRSLPPASYLGFASPTPVIDGAFGEWKLAGAAPDPLDAETAAGGDLVGVRAMTAGASGAFYAETRGPALEGASLRNLPPTVEVARPGPATAALPTPPTPRAPAPPLSADDRLLVYLDTDRNPATGYQPAIGGPVGAEFVLQVGGRFSAVSSAHLLRFAGASTYEAAWEPIGEARAAASGPSVEGEIPAIVLAATGAARVLVQTVAWSGRTLDFSDALQDASLDAPNPDDLLHFRAVTFDPLDGQPAVRQELITEVPNGYWVVQLNGEPEPAVMGAIEAAGATLYGYVHSNAYLAKMDESEAAAVRSMEEVRWVGIYQPAFKFAVDPATWGDGPLLITTLLFERPRDLQARVEETGAVVSAASDAALRVTVDAAGAEALGSIPEIQFIELEHRRVPLNDVGRLLQGVNQTFVAHGLNGSGIVVGISDSGVDFTHPAFDDSGTSAPNFDGRIVGYFKYAGSYGDSDGHGTHTAGSVLGDGDLSSTVNNSIAGGDYQFRGMAPAADLVVTEIFSGGTPGDDGVFADQEAFGATVSSNSWGYVDGQNNPITDYDISAYLTDLSVIDSNTSRTGLQPMTIVFAAGNDGAGANTAGSPGTSKNTIVVGASETNRGFDGYSDDASSIAAFSSRGPTDDGRIRPDVVAVGTYVLSTQSRTSGCSCTYGGWDDTWTGSHYAFSSGTSMATPMVAGIAALFQQHVKDTFGYIPSPALVKAALINGAEDLGYGYEFTGGVTGPMSQGWGRVNLTRSIDGPPGGTILLYDEGADIATGDVVTRRFTVASSSTPLKVTAVWTDAPGNPADTKTLAELVNDLDLVVRAPNGSYYHGNKFGGSWSLLNNTEFDRLNNVENVFVQSPTPGTWTVEVSGYLLRSAEQRYALAVSANLSEATPPSVADAHAVPGAPSNGRFGWNATASGSINGDAYNDLVVGAPGAGSGNGKVYIFMGGASENFATFDVSTADVVLNGTGAEGFGSSLDASGDFDGDGKRDLLIGAPNGGKAYLFKGAASWTSRSADITFNGSSSALFGAAVRLAPIDSTSGAEAIVGAPLTSNSTGAVYIFSGSGTTGLWEAASADRTLAGPANGSRLGSSLSAGDADGDTKFDLAVGAPGASIVKLAKGGLAVGSLGFNATVTGLPGTAFGQSVSLAGDVNGDGKADLVTGAPLANGSAGAGYVFFGRSPLADDQVLKTYFFDDMESGEGNWVELSAESAGVTGWGLSSSVFFGPSPSGHAWQEAAGGYGNDLDISIAFKSAVNLGSATSPVLSFVYKADLEEYASNYDGFMVLYSTNNGSSWTQLDSSNAQGHYDTLGFDPQGPPSSNTPITDKYAFTYDRFAWRQVTFNVTSLAGSSSVKFRFQFSSDNIGNGDGIYIDNVAVREARPSSPNYTVYGESSGDRLGWSAVSLGDLSGDGKAEFAFGAPDAPTGLTQEAGAVYVFQGSSGLSGSTGALSAAEVLRGSTSSGNLGFSLEPISSFNGSSQTFLFAGSPGLGGGSGGASIGNASAPIPELSDALAVAASVAGLALIGRRRRARAT